MPPIMSVSALAAQAGYRDNAVRHHSPRNAAMSRGSIMSLPARRVRRSPG